MNDLIVAIGVSAVLGAIVALSLAETTRHDGLIGSCHGKLMTHAAEDDFPFGCDWIMSRAKWRAGQ